MRQKMVRVRVRCRHCKHVACLPPDSYAALVKGGALELFCPQCAQPLHFNPLPSSPPSAPPAPPVPQAGVREERNHDPLPAVLPEPQRAVPPAFPPPPFAPLRVGNPAAAEAPLPAFAPLPAGPAAQAATPVAPQGVEAAPPAPRATLSERWKRLPDWQQWTVLGVLIVILGVVIFAMPTGGANRDTPRTREGDVGVHTPEGKGKDRPADEPKAQPARESTADAGKPPAGNADGQEPGSKSHDPK